MIQSGSNTAILFFSRSTRLESKNKRLIESSSNHTLIRHLRNRTLNEIKKTELPFFEFDEHDQVGDSFGERLASAFEAVFEKGFDHVISIGNDCPEIVASDLLLTTTLLHSNAVVLGPDNRGGAYLIGMNRTMFDLNTFQDLSWKSNNLVRSFKAQYGHRCDLFCLANKFDLNHVQDIKKYAKVSKPLVKLLSTLKNRFFTLDLKLRPRSIFLIASYRRGPPAMFS
ncbi:MAG: DUF2064 domain-containing protein [Bacteroidota bacterium]